MSQIEFSRTNGESGVDRCLFYYEGNKNSYRGAAQEAKSTMRASTVGSVNCLSVSSKVNESG